MSILNDIKKIGIRPYLEIQNGKKLMQSLKLKDNISNVRFVKKKKKIFDYLRTKRLFFFHYLLKIVRLLRKITDFLLLGWGQKWRNNVVF